MRTKDDQYVTKNDQVWPKITLIETPRTNQKLSQNNLNQLQISPPLKKKTTESDQI